MFRKSLIAALMVMSVPAYAQNINPSPAPTYASIRMMSVPVVAGDISDRPYRVIADVETNVRKISAFHKDASDEKVYRELWERAAKLGADAVVNAHLGESRVTAFSWGARKAKGQAIKFLTDSEIAEWRANQVMKEAPSGAIEYGQ